MSNTKRFLAIGIAVVFMLVIHEFSYSNIYWRDNDLKMHDHIYTGSSVYLSDPRHISNDVNGIDAKVKMNHLGNTKDQYWSQQGEEVNMQILQVVQNTTEIDKREQHIRHNQKEPITKDAPKEKYTSLTRPKVMHLLKRMNEGALMNRNYFVFLLNQVKKLLSSLETVYDVSIEGKGVLLDKTYGTTRFTIVGDIHGQYSAVLHIFQVNGFPSPYHVYIFNGDFMDKGEHSIENLLAIIAFKLYCPACIHFTRGNHETKSFLDRKVKGQIIDEYDEDIYDLVLEVMHQLPLAVIIENKILVMHAGITKPSLTLDEMRNITRGQEPEEGTLLNDLLWADPQIENGINIVPSRGTYFGPDVSKAFVDRHNLDFIVRGHSTVKGGYSIDHDGRVITIWSAPSPNSISLGAYLNIREDLSWEINQFHINPTVDHIDDWSILR